MNPTIDDLLRMIGQLYVENGMLRQRLGQLEQAGKKKAPPLKVVKKNDGDIQA
ncbi:hypothetical protein LCGC14_3101080 [marine sediment metagenome]|uniref:Transposase n=1 Tax=marine sediment metagenome TaxID=412755 RepID=A0A0F8YF94_9ZZZZ